MDIDKKNQEKDTDVRIADYLARNIKYRNTTTGTPVNQLYQKTVGTSNLGSFEKSRIKDKLGINDASKPKDVRDREKKERQLKAKKERERNHSLLKKEEFKTFPKDKVNRQIDKAKAKVDKEIEIDPKSIKNSSRAHSMTAARNFATKNIRPNKSIGVATNIMRKSVELDRRAKEIDQKQRNTDRELGNEFDKAQAQGAVTKDIEQKITKIGRETTKNTAQKAKLRSREKAIDTVQSMGARASGKDNHTQFTKNAQDKENLKKLKSSMRRTDMEINLNKEELELWELKLQLEQNKNIDDKMSKFADKIRKQTNDRDEDVRKLKSATSKNTPHGGDGGGISTKSKTYTLFGEGHCEKCKGEKCECGAEEKKKDSKKKSIVKTQYSMTVPRDDDDNEGGDGGGMSEAYSNWRLDLSEYAMDGYSASNDNETNLGQPVAMTSAKSRKKVRMKPVNNKIVINPPQGSPGMSEEFNFIIIEESVLIDGEWCLIEKKKDATKPPSLKSYENQPSSIGNLKSYSVSQKSKQQHEIQKRKHGVSKSASRGQNTKGKDKSSIATSGTRGSGQSNNPNLSQKPNQNFSPDRRVRINPTGTVVATAKTKKSTPIKTSSGFKNVNPERQIQKDRIKQKEKQSFSSQQSSTKPSSSSPSDAALRKREAERRARRNASMMGEQQMLNILEIAKLISKNQ